MNELLVQIALGFYGTALVGQVMLSEERINIIKDKIEVPLEIMCKFQVLGIFPSHFVSFLKRLDKINLIKDYRLNRKTRPPNRCWAQ